MKIGIAMFPTSEATPAAEVASAAEERGIESIFLAEHSHIPASRETPYPGGGELPPDYYHSWDPFVTLAHVAATTTTIRLGTGACLVTQRDPIQLAKEVATLDVISAGRVLLGVAAGWNAEELRNHGTDPGHRFAVMGERVRAMRAIWTEDDAQFHGRYVDFDAIWAWPKPVQRPTPPVIVCGNGARITDRVVEFGDEWMPNFWRVSDLPARIAELQQKASAAGREPIPVTAYAAPNDAAKLEALEEAGVGRAVLIVPAGSKDDTLRLLDGFASTATQVAHP
ncbi:MAG: LLM class F420-dependent oxidoreductase [Actinobacteria bacterium]|nr:LLM class F420-dependent oxidoreductase [Actinomycetota bacterium]